MPNYLVSTRGLAEALKAEGFPIPEHCAEARLLMPATGAFMLEYRVFVTADYLGQLGRALQRLGGDDPTGGA